MAMLQFDKLSQADTREHPFRHLLAGALLGAAHQHALESDFPIPRGPGFFPVEDCQAGPSFHALIEDLRSPEFARIVGDKLGIDLSERPTMVVARRWSALRDGRPHTDGADKVATALLYCNSGWSSEAGALRYLAGPDLEGPGSAPIPPVFGAFTAFVRSDESWHGHLPFEGERRVVQLFWLKDAAALERKTRRHKRADWLKALSPSRWGR
jgi:hypothetical protein